RLVWRWTLQCFELAADQARRHEMTRAVLETRLGDLEGDVQKQEPKVGPGGHGANAIAIAAAQRRTGNRDPFPIARTVGKRCTDALEPGPAVLVGQRFAPAHLSDVGGWMEIVAVNEGNPEALGQFGPDRGFARSGHSHYDERATVGRRFGHGHP